MLVIASGADDGAASALLDACRADDPGAELARIVADRQAGTPAFFAGVFADDDVAVFLHGPVELTAAVPGSRFDIALTSGAGWRQDRLNGLPQSLRVTTAPGLAGAGSALHDLVEGIVPGAGLALVARAAVAAEVATEPEIAVEPTAVAEPATAATRPELAAEPAPVAPEPTEVAEAPVAASEPAPVAEAGGGDHTMALTALTGDFEGGLMCGNGHPNLAGATQCQVCGMPLHDAGSDTALGRLVMKDGQAVAVDRALLIGRGVADAPEVQTGEFAAVVVPEGEAGVSRIHAEIRVDGWSAFLADRGSANGTFIQPPGTAEWIRLEPGHPVTIRPGVKIAVGPYELAFEPA